MHLHYCEDLGTRAPHLLAALHDVAALHDGGFVLFWSMGPGFWRSHEILRVWGAGAQIPLEEVPSVQKEVVTRCRQLGKPVIVASQLLQSMIEFPTPTRAEVRKGPRPASLSMTGMYSCATGVSARYLD